MEQSNDDLEATGQQYFCNDYYVHRMFTEWQQSTDDVPSDTESNATLNESIASFSGEVSGPRTTTRKPLWIIKRRLKQKKRKEHMRSQIRKGLLPKDATSALNDIPGPVRPGFTVSMCGTGTKAEVVLNNVKYEATNVNADANRHDATMKLPMECLAQYALHKLFTEWQVQGFKEKAKTALTDDQLKPKLEEWFLEPTYVPGLPKVAKTVADLPPDAHKYHPGDLFALMRPQVAYKDLGSTGDPTNEVHVAGLHTDGSHFFGTGRSKKLARKAAAAEACETLFGLKFENSVLE